MASAGAAGVEDADDRTCRGRRLIVLSAPSGTGKTTIARLLLEHHPDWWFSISATTRRRRDGEVDGRDYHFLTPDEFRSQVESDGLVEWEEIYGDFYGTLRSEIERHLATPESRVLFDVDVRGALAIRRAYPDDACLIFVAPPSIEELARRLSARKTEDREALQRRIARASMELSLKEQFDAVVVNDVVERAAGEIERLVMQ